MSDRAAPPLAVVLVAAGPSSRLGQSKQLVQKDGESLVRRSVRVLSSLQPAQLLVVTGCEAERVQAEVEGLSMRVVFNTDWARGMGSSISRGARSLAPGAGGVLIAVCDQWRLEAADLERLHCHWQVDPTRICVASWKEGGAFVSGPPVIFPHKLIPELKSMQFDRGARQLIDRYMDLAEFVDIPNAAFDLDRPEDLKRL